MKASKIVSILLILIMLLCFAACNKNANDEDVAVTVGNAKVGAGVFSYYLDTQIATKDNGISKSDAIKNAEMLCANYVYINTEFSEREIELTDAHKAEIASSVEDKWTLYGDYYKKIGVTKDILTKVMTSEYYEDLLINSIFGVGGDEEISEESQKSYYEENYIAFKVITAYYSGNEDEDEALKETFEGLKKKVKNGDTIDAVYIEYTQSIGASASDSLEVSVMKKDSDAYPDEFFTDVYKMKTGDLSVLSYDGYLFLVEKEDSSDYFTTYQNDILDDLIGDDFDKLIKDSYSKEKVTGNQEIEESCYETIKNLKSK